MNKSMYILLMLINKHCESRYTDGDEDWSFLVSLIRYDNNNNMVLLCSGSILSSYVILTAAHCMDNIVRNKQDINATVLTGGVNMFSTHLYRKIIDYKIHEKYKVDGTAYDIALLFLNEKIVFSDSVKKTVLIDKRTYLKLQGNSDLVVGGWGIRSLKKCGGCPRKLYSLHQSLMRKEECRYFPNAEEHNICTKNIYPDICSGSGDSGGPLVTNKDRIQLGIVSYKMKGRSDITIFTSVYHFRSWLNHTQVELYQKHCQCKIS